VPFSGIISRTSCPAGRGICDVVNAAAFNDCSATLSHS